jgi:hypothetical protein
MQPLQSVNCLDSRVHDHEQHRPFTQLVGLWLVRSGWVTRSRWVGSWNAAGAKPASIVLGLDIGGIPVSFG